MRCSPAVWVLSPPKPLPLCRGCAALNWDSILLPWAWAKMLLGVGLSWGWVVFWGHPEPLRGLCSLHTPWPHGPLECFLKTNECRITVNNNSHSPSTHAVPAA